MNNWAAKPHLSQPVNLHYELGRTSTDQRRKFLLLYAQRRYFIFLPQKLTTANFIANSNCFRSTARFNLTSCFRSIPNWIVLHSDRSYGRSHHFFRLYFGMRGIDYHAHWPIHWIGELVRKHLFGLVFLYNSFLHGLHPRMSSKCLRSTMDNAIYMFQGRDDKFAGNLESCNISVLENAGRDTNGKRLRRGPEMLVVS